MTNKVKGALIKVKEIPAWMWLVVALAGLGVEAYTARLDVGATREAAEEARQEATENSLRGAESERELVMVLLDTQSRLRDTLADMQARIATLEAKQEPRMLAPLSKASDRMADTIRDSHLLGGVLEDPEDELDFKVPQRKWEK